MSVRVYIHQPTVVFQALVNQAVVAYPTASVTYDTVSEGSFGAIEPEMTVLFGTSAGADDLGRQRIRKAADATTIYFGRSSPGVLDGEVIIQDDAHITVLNDYRPWMKAPFIKDDGTILKDHDIAYSDQNEDSPPVANAGPDRFGTVDSGTSKLRLTIPPTANTSFATADGATISSYLWTLPAGVTLVTGTLTSSQITVDVDAGQRYIKLVVTDSNGKTATARVFTVARGGSASEITKKARIVSHQRTQEGQLIELELLEALPAGSYNNGTRVVIWEGEPVGGDDLSHHVFSGWHMSDPARVGAERTGFLTDTTLRCGDMAAMMKRMPEFPVEIISTASPANWGQMTAPNMDKFLHFLLAHHTNVLELADWSWTGTTTDYPFVILGADGESAWDQVQRKAKALVPDYVLTCNRLGQLQTLPDPMIQQTADRTATVQKALSEGDISDISWEGQAFPRVHWLRGEAILAHASTISAIFCIAPGPTTGQGTNEQTSGEQLAKSQADLNWNEAYRYARLNAPYSYFTIVLAGSDDYDIDPADMTWITASLAAQYAAARGLTLASDRLLPREINTTWETSPTGTVETHELLCELETAGTSQAFTETYEEDIPDPDWDPGDDPGYDPDPPGVGDGQGTLYFVVDSALARTRDFSAASPSYDSIGPGGGLTFYDFILDPHAPTTTGYLTSSNGLYKSTDLDQASPTWSNVLSAADILSGTGFSLTGIMAKALCSINQEDYVACFYAAGNKRIFCSFSENGGTSWTHNLISANFSSVGDATGEIVDHIVGGSLKLYSAHNTGSGRQLFVSLDKGDTWSIKQIAAQQSSTMVCIHSPYDDNPSGQVIFVSMNSGAWRTSDGGDSWTSMDRTHAKDGIGTFTQDRQQVYLFRHDGIFLLSTDGGASFTAKATSGLSGVVRAAGGFPTNGGLFYALTTAGVFVSSDGGDTWTDKSGDWAGGFSITQYYGGTVVPLWVEE